MTRLNDRRFWIGGGVFVAVLIIAASYLIVIRPKFADAKNTKNVTAQTELQNTQLQGQIIELRNRSEQIGTYTAKLRDALEALPWDAGIPAFTRQLAAQAATANVSITSIAASDLVPVADGTAPVATPTDTDGTDTTSTTPAPAPASTTAAAPAAGTTSTAPADDSAAGGLYSAQIVLGVHGTKAHDLRLLNLIQTVGPRRALVSSFQLAVGSTRGANNVTTMTVNMSIFSSPQTPDQVAALQKLLNGTVTN